MTNILTNKYRIQRKTIFSYKEEEEKLWNYDILDM